MTALFASGCIIFFSVEGAAIEPVDLPHKFTSTVRLGLCRLYARRQQNNTETHRSIMHQPFNLHPQHVHHRHSKSKLETSEMTLEYSLE